MASSPTPKPTFGRNVSHQDAFNAASDLIASHFGNKPRKGGGVYISIPAAPDNTDLLLMDYIKQQWAKDAMLPAVNERPTLLADNARLRKALEKIANDPYKFGVHVQRLKLIASKALIARKDHPHA